MDTHRNFETLVLRGGSVKAAGMSLMDAARRREGKQPEILPAPAISAQRAAPPPDGPRDPERDCSPERLARARRKRVSDLHRCAACGPLLDPDPSPVRRFAPG